MRAAFAKLDKNGDGVLDRTEVGRLLKAMGLPHGGADVRAVFARLDVDGDNGLSLGEILRALDNDAGRARPVQPSRSAVCDCPTTSAGACIASSPFSPCSL